LNRTGLHGVSSNSTQASLNAFGVSLGVSLANTDNRVGSIGITNINYRTSISTLSTIKLGISANTLPSSFINSSLTTLGTVSNLTLAKQMGVYLTVQVITDTIKLIQ
jgi:hypothetical protein